MGSIGVRFFGDAFPVNPPLHPALPLSCVGSGSGGSGQYGLTIEIGHAPPSTATVNHHLSFTVMNGAAPIQCFNTVEVIQAGRWHTFVGSVRATGNTGYLNGVEMTDRHSNIGDASTTDFFSAVRLWPRGAPVSNSAGTVQTRPVTASRRSR